MNASRAVALRPPLAGPSDARLPLPVLLVVVVAIVSMNAAGWRRRAVEASTDRLIMLAFTSNAYHTAAEPGDMSRSRIDDGEAERLVTGCVSVSTSGRCISPVSQGDRRESVGVRTQFSDSPADCGGFCLQLAPAEQQSSSSLVGVGGKTRQRREWNSLERAGQHTNKGLVRETH